VQAPSLARSFVQSMLCKEHAQSADAVVTLLTDELVTQALLYGAPPIEVTLKCHVTELTIEVADAAQEPTAPPAPDHELSMLLVDKVSHSWGTTMVEGDGKVVWCTVPSGALPRMRSYRPWSASEHSGVERARIPIAGAPRAHDGESPAV
jgi:hypothetical protein